VPTPSSPDAILATPLAQLEIIIGDALLAEEFGSKEHSDAEKRSVARRWFENNLDAFRRQVCGSSTVVQAAIGPAKKDRNALLGALVDVLGTLYGATVPVAALAAMIVHYGVDRLCSGLAADGA
jgi:hypothetical protein